VSGRDRTQALERSRRALAEFVVEGMPTVIPFHAAVVDDPAFIGTDGFAVHTRWIETEFDNKLAPYDGVAESAEPAEWERVTVEVGGKRLEVVLPAGLGATAGNSAGTRKKPARRSGGSGKGAAVSGDALTSPMQGTIVKIAVEEGATVSEGDLIVVLEAMKMEQPLNAHKSGTVSGLSAEVGATVTAGAVICQIKE
jgi:acetyl-CoA/propionyl-CoA carboxylase biotin carboxyl carrier protein